MSADAGDAPSHRLPEWLRARVAVMAGIAGLVAVMASLAVAGLAEGVAERGDLTLVDPSVSRTVISLRDPVLTAAARATTFVGSEPSIGAMSVLLVAWLVLRRRAWMASLLVGSAMAASAAATLALKHLLARPRPPASAVLGVVDTGYSFPSGHTLSSTVFFGLLAGLALSRVSIWPARVAVAVAWVAATVAVGLSRLYLGYHWLTDVLGGWSTGVVILALTAGVAVLATGRRTRGIGGRPRAGQPGCPGGETAASAGQPAAPPHSARSDPPERQMHRRLPAWGFESRCGVDRRGGVTERARHPVVMLVGATCVLLGAFGCSSHQPAGGADPESVPGPYYAWDGGGWRFYALNCEIDCRQGSPEETWLRKDLAVHPGTPSLAYVHRPRFTCSTKHAPDADLTAIWNDLEAADGQLMLAGHNHSYERFALLDGDGRPDLGGLRQFVVGTGGAALYPLQRECPNRQAQNDTTKGVLKLTLTPTSYAWQFISVDRRVLDSGTQAVS